MATENLQFTVDDEFDEQFYLKRGKLPNIDTLQNNQGGLTLEEQRELEGFRRSGDLPPWRTRRMDNYHSFENVVK